MTIKEKVESLVHDSLTDGSASATADLEVIPQAEKLSGYVVWDDFYGKSHRDHQRELCALLRSRLTNEEQSHLSAILTFTPAEYDTLSNETDG